jgi:hypothetical protein
MVFSTPSNSALRAVGAFRAVGPSKWVHVSRVALQFLVPVVFVMAVSARYCSDWRREATRTILTKATL